MKFSILKKLVFSLLYLVSLSACGVDSEVSILNDKDQVKTDETGSSTQNLYIGSSSLYNNPRIHVCWEPETLPGQNILDMVKNHIKSTYEPYTSLHFDGWQKCDQVGISTLYSTQIRIYITPDRPHVVNVGTKSRGKYNMQLNTTYTTFDPNCPVFYGLDACIRNTAAHEFGHAIGAYHEQTRSDTPSDCTNWLIKNDVDGYQINTSDDRTIAPYAPNWDFQSIMNYCNSENFNHNGTNYANIYGLSFNNGGKLSYGDIINWRGLYGSDKMSYGSSTAFNVYLDGTDFSFVNGNKANVFQRPDLWMIQWATGTTGSGKVEVSGASSSSNYQTKFTLNQTSLPAVPIGSNFFGFNMAHIDNDNTPELVYFYRDKAANRLRMYTLSGASGWKTTTLNQVLPLESDNNYKFIFDDYNGDGITDLITLRMADSYTLDIAVWKGPSFTTNIARSNVPFSNPEHDRCRYVAGNFFNNNRKDILCMGMAQQDSATLYLAAIKAGSNFSNPYSVVSGLGDTQIKNDDGRYANFGMWVSGASGSVDYPLLYLPGEGLKIGYIKRTKTAGRTEIYYIDPTLYL
jgi:hypothetical protein